MKNLKALTVLLALAGAASLAQAQDIKGDAKAGEKKNAMCIGCHGIEGYQASFPQIYKVPKISGQNAKYITAALTAYRQGDRKHPSMRGIAGSLSDQDIADLAAYYETSGKDAAAAAPAAAELPAPLKDKLALCVACHGTNFNNTTDPANPRLAGQYADYLTVALQAYRTKDKQVVGRGNPTMVGMAATLSDAEVKQVAAYLAGLPGELKTVSHAKFR
ncbi:c-type cytochrome [Ideonella sp.]|uniref:c-type cytochrome n=1 Tax=Ideonella sp. TaxID=1929293 RepID=UPI002B47CF8A|nr:c-type cytochrome [Ideonella sp.]HJV69298.1 c-type cytochrome [Ideonella sp.]